MRILVVEEEVDTKYRCNGSAILFISCVPKDHDAGMYLRQTETEHDHNTHLQE